MKHVVSTFAGLLFGFGLMLGGMTKPSKVVGFLDIAGAWDPSLMFVMGGAVGVHAVLYRLARRRHAPVFDTRFHVPESRTIDAPLIAGAALFGVGWGIGGFCPGPAVVSLASGAMPVVVFVASMLTGMVAYRRFLAPRA